MLGYYFILGLIALAILLLVILKYNKIQREWIIAAFMIAILSFLGLILANEYLQYPILTRILSGYSGGPAQLWFLSLAYLLVFVSLSVFYARIRKESLMKIMAASFLVFLAITFVALIIASTRYCDRSISVEKSSFEPAYYINITNQDLKKFPSLKKAIASPGTNICISGDDESLRKFIQERCIAKYNSSCGFTEIQVNRQSHPIAIRVGNDYYSISVIVA